MLVATQLHLVSPLNCIQLCHLRNVNIAKTIIDIIILDDRSVKVFRYQPVHKTHRQPIIGRLVSKRLTMRKPRELNSVLWGLLDCLLALIGKIISRI
jgi:hypothetical protein